MNIFELGVERGMEKGREEGRIETKTLINQLNSILIKAGRFKDLERSTQDSDYQEQLIQELLTEEMQII